MFRTKNGAVEFYIFNRTLCEDGFEEARQIHTARQTHTGGIDGRGQIDVPINNNNPVSEGV